MIEDFLISARDRCRVKRMCEAVERESRDFVARGFDLHDNYTLKHNVKEGEPL